MGKTIYLSWSGRSDIMDHLVCLDSEAKELERLTKGIKSMIVHGAAERKPPHGQVGEGDTLYFVLDSEDGLVRAKARVKNATSSPMLNQEASIIRLIQNQRKLMLTEQQVRRWGGRRYMVFVEVEQIEHLEPFCIDRSVLSGKDGWAVVGDIAKVQKHPPSN